MISISTRIQKTAVYFCAIILSSVSIQCLAEAPQAAPLPEAIHPATRQTIQPSNNAVVDINPPSLLWPVVKRKDIRYRVRLSQDPKFASDRTIKSDDLCWAIFNPHTKLTPGTWYWSYEVLKDGKIQDKSKTYRFVLSDSSRNYVTPAPKPMLSACPASHPRILITARELASFRQRTKSSSQARSIAAELDPARPATMEIKSSDQKAALTVNKNSISLGTKTHAATQPNSSILIEKLPGGDIIRESPDHTRYVTSYSIICYHNGRIIFRKSRSRFSEIIYA